MDALTPREPEDDTAAQALRRLEARPSLVFGRVRFVVRQQVWGVQDALRPVARALASAQRASRDDYTLAAE